MDTVCSGLDFLFVYLDDILVASIDMEMHLQYLCLLFDQLSQHGLVINVAKCQFGCNEVDFLDHRIIHNGILPLPDKVAAITNFPKPSTVKGLWEFLGMVHFYNCFIPTAAAAMQPLYAASGGQEKIIKWSPDMESAFVETKNLLACTTLLVHPRVDAPMAIATDASDIAIGNFLQQLVSGVWQPLAFFSCQFRVPERHWSTFDRELLALHLTIWHFRYLLEGRHFVAFTDHKPLVFAFHKICWSMVTSTAVSSGLHFQIHYWHATHLWQRQFCCQCIVKIRNQHHALRVGYWFCCRGHCTARRCRHRNLQDMCYWSGSASCAFWCSADHAPLWCVHWLSSSSSACHFFDVLFSMRCTTCCIHPSGPPKLWLPPSSYGQASSAKWACGHTHVLPVSAPRFNVMLELRYKLSWSLIAAGPFPILQGHTMLFTIMDHFTHRPEVIPMSGDTSAAACAWVLLSHWISRFGLPVDISSDRSLQFTSQLWTKLARLLGTTLWTVKVGPHLAFNKRCLVATNDVVLY